MLYKAYFCLQNYDGLKDVQNVLSATYNKVTCLGGYVLNICGTTFINILFIFLFKIFAYISDHLVSMSMKWLNILQTILEIKPIK